MAMMLAAMNSDFTRFFNRARNDGPGVSSMASGAAGAAGAADLARVPGACWSAACAARRAAAMKLDLPPAAAAGAGPPSAASDAAMRADALARSGGGPEPGSSG